MAKLCAIFHLDGRPVAEETIYAGLGGATDCAAGRSVLRPSPNVAFGARRTIPPSSDLPEPQPVELCQRGPYALAACARIDNRKELLVSLSLDAATNVSVTDGQLILAVYGREGVDGLSRLIGDFALVLWDGSQQTLVMARDGLGMRRLLYTEFGQTIGVASDAEQLVQIPGVSRQLDEVFVADYLLDQSFEPTRTPFASIRQVAPGHVLLASRGSSSQHRFWRLEDIRSIRYPNAEDYAERLLELIRRAMADRLRGESPVVGVFLSGGLDSSTVASVAANLFEEEGLGRRIDAFSFQFKSLDCDEGFFIDAVRHHCALQVHGLDAEKLWLDPSAPEHSPRLDSPFTGWARGEAEAHRILRREGGSVCLTGHGGDNLFTGSPEVFLSLLLRGRPLQALSRANRYCQPRGLSKSRMLYRYFLAPLLPKAAEMALRRMTGRGQSFAVPPWLAPGFARRLDLRRRALSYRDPRRFCDPARQDKARLLLDLGSVGRACHWMDEFAERRGVEMRHPFLDRRLAEFAIAVPQEEHFNGSLPKRLLRRSMKGLLPEAVRLRKQKTLFGAYLDHSFRERAREDFRTLFRHPILEERGFVNGRLLREIYDRYCRDESQDFRGSIWSIVTMERWLQRYGNWLE